MAVTAAKARVIKQGGTSTAFTNEACTKVTANTVYQITDTTKRVLDPTVALTVQVDPDGGGASPYATVGATTYTVDYLFGTITFASDQGASATVRVSAGNYIPTVTVAKVKEISYNATRDQGDSTSMDSAGYHGRTPTLLDLSGSLTSFESMSFDHDPGGGVQTFISKLTGGTAWLLEDRSDPSGSYFRAWVLISSLENSGAVNDLLELVVSFVGTSISGSGRVDVAAFGWGT
jgi:hypothetical protein